MTTASQAKSGADLDVSIVIPVYNEESNVEPMAEAVHQALVAFDHRWELIFINDGSSDQTQQRLVDAAERYGEHVRVIELQRNFGQTAAMQAGIDAAQGDILVTLDGDLQNDPRDIPRMVQRMIDEDLDLLAGWRKDRKDNLWLRKVPSRIANKLIGRLSGIRMHDYGCSLKIYRMEVMRDIRFYGEMHRFIPAWVAAHTSPSRIKEEVVTHHARQYGTSKYGLSRVYRVLLDLFSVYFFMSFRTRPAHFFGRIGMAFGGLGSLMLAYLLFVKLFHGEDIGNRPMLMTGIFLVLMSVQLFTTGLLGEVMTRTYYESSGKLPYVVRQRYSVNLEASQWKPAAARAAAGKAESDGSGVDRSA